MESEHRYTIDDLTTLTGCSRRTIRFYVERGLLDPPSGRGRGGFYSEVHLARLKQIVAAREGGQSLASIVSGATNERSAHSSALAFECAEVAPIYGPGASRNTTPDIVYRWALAPGVTLEVESAVRVSQEELIHRILESAASGAGTVDHASSKEGSRA